MSKRRTHYIHGMKIHFIAIGGSAMHNLAIALSRKGIAITGSDDEIFEPSRSRLLKEGILPEKEGWQPEKISPQIGAVVLGMHARADNPELARARELDIPVYSYPEYVYEQTRDKRRVVIGGSHGKTTITGMLLHVLKMAAVDTDYLVGAQLEGYDCMVRLTANAAWAVIEGDEYLSSPIDRRPKFHLYKPNIALLTGVAWDHINVFPTFDNYVEQFRIFVDLITPGGHLVYYAGDPELEKLVATGREDISYHPYTTHAHHIAQGVTTLHTDSGEFPLRIFGDHNLQNISGAMQVLRLMGLNNDLIYRAISTFSGASKRLELVHERDGFVFYKDFAHAPSKLKATTAALKAQFPDRALIACMELHTFSSLNKKFLPLYEGAMAAADRALVYFNPKVLEHKRLEPLSPDEVKDAFASENVEVYTDTAQLQATLKSIAWKEKNLLMMSSGNFDGLDFTALSAELH
jgi:UDP-N-acetylmuramate: L-alanyl-gamma-D-glutamyl-meso-diaminopimelate ligase